MNTALQMYYYKPIQGRQIRCYFFFSIKKSIIVAPIPLDQYSDRRKWFWDTYVYYFHVQIVCSIFVFLQHYLITLYTNVLVISRYVIWNCRSDNFRLPWLDLQK